MDWVGVEPTTSAAAFLHRVYLKWQLLKENITVQIPPAPFFFTCSVTFCTVKRSLEKGEATELQLIQSYRSDVSSNHSVKNRNKKRIE
jgi:hypothetical protein